ncbi:hypothetical protein RchiOBHm_Chr1g0360881 [Rosa chinensis]|uniref:Uncharacterized protein n=1 Tax=Rosa chinensis TaxID=74649 RepID=A0A2P6SIQ4_ROSCH|nr:hypothetical protein RchiOBHm_Chr1g0360881 [Rosa chinensis]
MWKRKEGSEGRFREVVLLCGGFGGLTSHQGTINWKNMVEVVYQTQQKHYHFIL